VYVITWFIAQPLKRETMFTCTGPLGKQFGLLKLKIIFDIVKRLGVSINQNNMARIL